METGKKIFYLSPDTGKESGNISTPVLSGEDFFLKLLSREFMSRGTPRIPKDGTKSSNRILHNV